MRPSESRNWRQRIGDILDALAKIERYTARETFESFRDNEILQDAIAFNFIVLGEAAGHIPDEVQTLDPAIPWANMRAMRNVLAHQYWGRSADVVWETVQHNLLPLVGPLSALLDSDDAPASP